MICSVEISLQANKTTVLMNPLRRRFQIKYKVTSNYIKKMLWLTNKSILRGRKWREGKNWLSNQENLLAKYASNYTLHHKKIVSETARMYFVHLVWTHTFYKGLSHSKNLFAPQINAKKKSMSTGIFLTLCHHKPRSKPERFLITT